jgi:hypothetical protein
VQSITVRSILIKWISQCVQDLWRFKQGSFFFFLDTRYYICNRASQKFRIMWMFSEKTGQFYLFKETFSDYLHFSTAFVCTWLLDWGFLGYQFSKEKTRWQWNSNCVRKFSRKKNLFIKKMTLTHIVRKAQGFIKYFHSKFVYVLYKVLSRWV